MIAILALMGKTFMQPGGETLPPTPLRLGKPLLGLAPFLGMRNLFATGEGEEMMKARIQPYGSIAGMRNRLRGRLDEETEIPARSALDQATAFDASCRDTLGMEPHRP